MSSEKNHFGISLAPSDATKALEKMSELSKLGVGDEFRPIMPLPGSVSSGGSSGRHSAWQSHWLNKGAEQAKDVLKCVWCKQSFPSLAAMTTHMQEAKHCGVNVPGISPLQPLNAIATQPSQGSTNSSAVSSSSVGASSSSKSNASDLNLLIKETMPLPRKLVRGQDVWLGKGAEQTRQILKCMWCGQSFRSLAEMTSHMQQTQHYTNIISQEQIISWKSAEENKSGSGSSSSGNQSSSANANSSSTNSHVSAVLTCKVCDQAFSSLKELSNHMVKNSHYKEHIMRSITESGGRRRQTREKRKKSLPVRKLLELERAQNELKNGDNMMMTMMMMGGGKPGLHSSSSSRITCEKCGDKIDMAVFVEHIRLCVGANASLTDDKKNLLKSALMSYNSVESLSDGGGSGKSLKDTPPPPSPFHQRLSPKTSEGKDVSSKSDSKSSSPSVLNAIEKLIEKSFEPRSRHSVTGYSSSGSQSGNNSSIGSSILKRLGIDESVDYTKPLMDVNMQAAKAYVLGSQFHNSHFEASYYGGAGSRRERSGSESSSVSERGSSRPESLTPDRKPDIRTPPPNSRSTPEKRTTPPLSKAAAERTPKDVDVKREPKEDDGDKADEESRRVATPSKVEVKAEPQESSRNEDEEELVKRERRSSSESLAATPKSIVALGADEQEVGEDLSSRRGCGSSNSSRRDASSPMAPGVINSAAASPACRSIADRASVSPSCTNVSDSPTNSERSVTPRSTSDKKASGSLGALSSMFDSLSGAHPPSASSEAPAQSNKASSHPLAALQKLCDKTETHHGGSSSRSSAAAASNHAASAALAAQSNAPGAILAFSWACNDAVVTDSIMKCAFCDTPFVSKGAYRHHLSKMHFVKDGVIPDTVPIKSPNGGTGSSSSSSSSQQNLALPTSLVLKNSNALVENNCKTGGSSMSVSSSCSSIKSPQSQNTFDESPHSKFLKYTELAKQLSSKYV